MAQQETRLIRLPQESDKSAAAFESMLVQLHETLARKAVSFELMASGQNIACCFTAETSTAELVTAQIYALASDAEVITIPDPLTGIGKAREIAGAEFRSRRSKIYPLRVYPEFEGDSLTAILSVLSKCVLGEMALVQIVTRPISDSWFHHLSLMVRRKVARIRHLGRPKYWFKRGVSSVIQERILDKSGQRLFSTSIRVAAISFAPDVSAAARSGELVGALRAFNTLDLNQLSPVRLSSAGIRSRVLERRLSGGLALSAKELATIFHLPRESEVPNVLHVLSKRQAPPRDLPTKADDPNISFFGLTNFRNQHVRFGINRLDRRRHLYTVGKSGSGKSRLLELLINSDLQQGHGVAVLDPHGDLVDNVLRYVPQHRLKDVVIFDPSDLEYPPSFNPLEQVPDIMKTRVTIGIIEIFKKLFGSNWSPRLEHVLRYTILALLDTPESTVLSILQILSDKNYRQYVVSQIKDDVVKSFWVNEFSGWSEKFDAEAITPLLNKVGQFVATNMIRNIVGQPINRFRFREFMDTRKILLMKLSKGILGEENSALMGAMALTKLYQAAMSRADIQEKDRVDFYVYVDEFQNFATDTLGEILSEARKYRLNLTLAHQFLGQLDQKMRRTVFGNVGSMISFRMGGEDAAALAEEFTPRFGPRDIINLGVREFCIKLSIQGEMREAFSGTTLSIEPPEKHIAEECIAFSRANYSRPLKEVTAMLKKGTAKQGPVKPAAPETPDFPEPIL